MKKKNFFAQYKQFTFFLILAVVIILIAVFAPVVSGGVDPLKGSLDTRRDAKEWCLSFLWNRIF